jgi:hypothetical protein
VNTTGLITHWSMEGAMHDIDRRFGPAVDILAAVAEPASEPLSETVQPAESTSTLLVKRAGDDEWQPLGAGA